MLRRGSVISIRKGFKKYSVQRKRGIDGGLVEGRETLNQTGGGGERE